MNNTYSFEQISKTGNIEANSILRQYKSDLTSRFMETKSNIPKLTKQNPQRLG